MIAYIAEVYEVKKGGEMSYFKQYGNTDLGRLYEYIKTALCFDKREIINETGNWIRIKTKVHDKKLEYRVFFRRVITDRLDDEIAELVKSDGGNLC